MVRDGFSKNSNGIVCVLLGDAHGRFDTKHLQEGATRERMLLMQKQGENAIIVNAFHYPSIIQDNKSVIHARCM